MCHRALGKNGTLYPGPASEDGVTFEAKYCLDGTSTGLGIPGDSEHAPSQGRRCATTPQPCEGACASLTIDLEQPYTIDAVQIYGLNQDTTMSGANIIMCTKEAMLTHNCSVGATPPPMAVIPITTTQTLYTFENLHVPQVQFVRIYVPGKTGTAPTAQLALNQVKVWGK